MYIYYTYTYIYIYIYIHIYNAPMAPTAGHRGDLGVSAFQVEETGRSLLVKTHLVGRLSGAPTFLPIFLKMDWHMAV